MSYQFLKTRLVNHTLWIELHNPPVNFLTTDILVELYRAIRAAEQDDEVRVIVFTGGLADRYVFHFSIPELTRVSIDNKALLLDRIFAWPFSAAIARWQMALNLRLMRRFPAYERFILNATRRLRSRTPTLFVIMQMAATNFAIENCRKITIAAINGTCNGGGTEMSASFDFRFMVGDAGFTIGQPEVLVGILPGGGGTQRVTRLIGKARAVELMLACDQWTPQYAKQAGLITDHFARETFVQQVQDYADRMSLRNLRACHETRLAISRGLDAELSRGLALEMAGFVRCTTDPGTQAALVEYANYLQEEVEQKPDSPVEIERIVEMMESERITNYYKSPSDD